MRRNFLALLACVSLVFPTAVSVAQPLPERSEVDAPTLRGTTLLKTSETVSTLVRFPRGKTSADLALGIAGDGRVYGVVLRKIGESSEGTLLAMERCTERGCDGGRGYPSGAGFGAPVGGLWRVYVIADGAPVTVTLELSGVPGRMIIRPEEPVSHRIASLDPRIEVGPSETIVSAGEYEPLEGAPDFGAFQMWREGRGHYGSVYKECYYYSLLPMPPEDAAFVPGCPTSFGADETRAITGDGGKGGPWFRLASFGEISGLGGWYSTTAAPKLRGATVFWMEYLEE